MSYHGFGSRIRLEPGAVPAAFLAWLCIHGLIFLILLFTQLSLPLRLGLAFLNAWALSVHLAHWAWPLHSLGLDGLELTPGGRLLGRGPDGEWRPLRLTRVAWLAKGLVVLQVRAPGRRGARWLILPASALGERRSRRLRVHLRWGGVERVPGPLGRLLPARPVGRHEDSVPGPVGR